MASAKSKSSLIVSVLAYAWGKAKSIDNEQRRDIVALIVLAVCLFLISRGVNSTVSGITLAIVGYYFGRRNIIRSSK